mgnify:CR=1 FL=1
MKKNIEKDIKILETFLNGNKCCKDCEIICADCYIDYDEVQAIKHILSEYKRMLKENEKLREYYEEQIQKVKDKIELLGEKAKHEQNAQVLVQLYKQIKVLRELLEREEIYEK